jgi:DNA-binding transcriptional MerR regulator
MDEPRYGIEELASLGGVTRRTVRYYVQEGLIPAPLGVGRGRHYGPEHLARLLEVKSLQEAGRSLEDIRRIPAGNANAPAPRPDVGGLAAPPGFERSFWRRLAVSPGIELHVAGELALPSPQRLEELAQWCRKYFVRKA